MASLPNRENANCWNETCQEDLFAKLQQRLVYASPTACGETGTKAFGFQVHKTPRECGLSFCIGVNDTGFYSLR